VPSGKSGIQYVTWASPDVKTVELGSGPDGSTEEFQGRLAGMCLGNPVQDVGCVKDRERPEFDVRDVRPVEGLMMKHRSGNRKNCADVLFGDTIVMVCSSAGKSGHLVKLFQVCSKVSGCEGGLVVTDVSLYHYSQTGGKLFELFYNRKCFV